jgi:carbon monoxide dehydrogenase subunit G
MAFQIDKTFVVRAPPQAVWDLLTDPRRVARCLPGAAITEQLDPKTWAGTLAVKVGPVTASYRGQLQFARLDAAAREAELHASGQDVRGKGGARMKLTSRVIERAPGETEVVASSELEVTGLLAQMGRGMVQDVGDQIFRKFTDAMRAELEAPAPAAAAPAPEEPAAPASGGPTARVQVPAAQVPAAASAATAAHAGPAQPPIDVLSMGAGAAARAAGRSLRRPGAWLALAAFVFLVFWLLGRSRP